MIGHRMAVFGWTCATLLLAGAACRSGPQVSGSYDLKAVNQRPLPFQGGAVAGTWIEVTGGVLILRPDGTYERRLRFDSHSGSTVHADSSVQTGQYERRMSTVVLHAAGGDETADLTGTAVVMTIRGWRYLFRKPVP